MKRLMLFFASCFAVFFFNNALFADEIFKDKDGVWRNMEAKQSKTVIEGVADQVFVPPKESDEIYQDKDGVWRNRTVKDQKPIADGMHSISQGLYDGVHTFLDATVGDSARTAIENQGPSSKDHINRILEKNRQEHQYREDVKRIEELKQPKSDFSGYERFDPSKAGEAKSEWEYFDDPRSKK